MDIFGNLNDKQRQAVLATEGYVRVIAGAGSGKTKLLVSRYAYLVTEYGIDPSNILCVTFTNKAAGEMKKRIQNLIGPEYSSSLICTYHGFCARLLREDPEKLFLSKGFQIIDSYQQRSILAEIYAKYELKLDFATFQKMLEKIGKYKYDLKYVPRMITAEPVQIMDSITDLNDQILEEYLQRQKALYCLDFEDLMNYALYLLKTDEGIREKWQSRLNYIMVDEFQDSDRTETELIEILSGQYKNLMIVGDPDQNIYEWRGSDVGLLVDFDKTHPETQTIILNQNYRSTPQILHLANTLIEKNELRLKKDLFTLSGSGSPVNHVHSRTEDDEVAYLVKVIKEQTSGLAAQRTFGDFAILYRSSFLSRVVERKLVQENIPYEIYGGVKFYQRMEIQDVVAYLRMIAWNDDVSFKRVVNTPKRKFGRVRVAALENIRNSNDVSLFEDDLTDKTLYEVLKGHLSDPAFNGSGGYEFVSLIERMKSLAPTVTLGELVNTVCAASGYEQYIRELGDEERLDNLSEFKRIANEFEQGYGENVSLETFLQQIALMSAEDDDKPKDAVRLMTIHASKGLEFPVVFLMGCTEGIFPSSKTIEQRKKMGLEEERRLAYVAITRAKDQLYLMDSEGVSQKGMQKLPSRFLFEVGEENYVRIGHLTERLLDEATMYIRQLNISMMDESDFLLGYGEGDGSEDECSDDETKSPVIAMQGPQMVEHHIFGRGEVLSFDKKRKVFQIQFEGMDMPRSISAAYFLQGHEPLPEPPQLPPEVGSGAADGELLVTEPNESFVAASDLPARDEFASADSEKFASVPARDEDTTWYRKLPAWDADNSGTSSAADADDAVGSGTWGSAGGAGSFEETTEEYTEMTPEDVSALSAELREKLANSPNHWKDPSFPQTGWTCTGIEDLGSPTAVCEMCGFQIIRYVHYMYHPQAGTLGCGCVCAGRLEGDLANARAREAALRSRAQRKVTFRKRTWKRSAKGSEYLTYKQHLIVLLHWRNPEQWRFAIDGTISDKAYESRLACIDAIFDYIENQA